ncbi:MAG TPA: AAA family ATPase [Longimicrobium sp.]|nr:AAA family ATPase [Longimicrobium sp.]
MNDDLPLRSFEVEGFRAIHHLRVPELERVNLFVGQNNAGKTSLLEAVRLYLHRDKRALAALVFEIVRDHTDYRPGFTTSGRRSEIEPADIEAALQAMESLFHGSFDELRRESIKIGPLDLSQDVLTLRIPWSDALSGSENGEADQGSGGLFFAPETPLLVIEHADGKTPVPLDWFLRRVPLQRSERQSDVVMIPAVGFDPYRIPAMWDRIAVSGSEDLVEAALRIVEPEVERVLLVGEAFRRSVLVRLRGVLRPVPLQTMGDGINRVFGIALAMVQARGGVVLIDEVENGLHFTVQDEVWRAIFALARELNVQVLATTHSWDSIVGFQYAANMSEEEGMLYRLERTPEGKVEAIRFTEEEVEIAAEQRIEIR